MIEKNWSGLQKKPVGSREKNGVERVK